MESDRLNRWLTLGANIGVIVGIVVLVAEIRQSNLAAIASNDIALRQLYASQNESIYSNRDFAELVFKARNPDTRFSGAEREMIDFFVAREFNTWGAIERANRTGLTSTEALDAALDDLHWLVETYPALKVFIREIVDAYPAQSESIVFQRARELVEHE